MQIELSMPQKSNFESAQIRCRIHQKATKDNMKKSIRDVSVNSPVGAAGAAVDLAVATTE